MRYIRIRIIRIICNDQNINTKSGTFIFGMYRFIYASVYSLVCGNAILSGYIIVCSDAFFCIDQILKSGLSYGSKCLHSVEALM